MAEIARLSGYREWIDLCFSQGGDSGGAHYMTNEDPSNPEATIAAIHRGSWDSCPDPDVQGVFIGDAEDQLEVTV